MRLLQSLGAKVVTRASLFLLCFPCSFLSIGSNMVAPMAVGVAAVVISIAMSIGTSLFLSPASPMSMSLLSLTLASLIVSVRQLSFLEKSSSSLAHWSTRWVSRVFAKTLCDNHSIAWILVGALLLQSRQCWDTRFGVNSTSRIDRRCPFFNCYRCCRLIALFLFRQDILLYDPLWFV